MQAFLLLLIVSCVLLTVTEAFAGRMRSMRGQMSMMARKPIIAGNWKMNTDLESALKLAQDVTDMTSAATDVDIAIIPPAIFLRDVSKVIEGSAQKIGLGAQSAFAENKGAYTGATSAPMLKSIGAQYCLVGHSERRAIFNEQDSDLNGQVNRLLEAGIVPILCIGETQEEYELGLNGEVCSLQIKKDLKGLTGEQVKNIVIAYEPIWAIGTGLTATPEVAQSVHAAIRQGLTESYGKEIADGIRIQYGGSVTPESVDELMKQPDIDGALVGGASLVAEKFARIVNFNK